MAGSLQRAYVLQAPVSHAVVLRARLLDGLRYAGPALFCVYAPAPDDDPARSTYLRAAAAAESRVFPVLVFDPAKGETLADRVDLSGNTQGERSWPAEAFAYRDAGGEAASVDLAFTPLDYLYGDRRLEGEFWNLSPDLRHESLTPAHEYLEMPAEEASSRIPYVLTVDRDGRIGRAIATRAVVEAALSCRAFWRGVQEWGGIDNSHAKRAVAAEADRLAREKEREIEAIEKNYLAQLDTDVGELAREIVQRIASSLMGTEGEAFVAKPTLVAGAPAAAAPAPTAEPAASTPAEAEEEEAVSFDDPYIDTPLCTSCNECTQLNARMFAYNANKQAEIRDAAAGPFSDLVRAAELCPVHIIHPGKPKNPGEPGLEEWVARAARFN
jgi:ferredoxin